MAFWNRSDDPWDVDPDRARAKRKREPRENPLDALKGWNEERRAKAAAKQAELEARPKEVCPWCGREMERGYLLGGRDGITWTPGFLTARAAWLGPSGEAKGRRLKVNDEGEFISYKTAWYCGDCRKMVIDAAGMRAVNAAYTWPEPSPCAEEADGGEGETP